MRLYKALSQHANRRYDVAVTRYRTLDHVWKNFSHALVKGEITDFIDGCGKESIFWVHSRPHGSVLCQLLWRWLNKRRVFYEKSQRLSLNTSPLG
ncbi:Uncharacterised protein [Vibrio cholerae]|nr:Uncharacterised protein [Vibrio cholerae]CSB48821.1 Uncharacterised protein [Vibrio cholerae]CSD52773.1 Uncharacterised protein [Vibrio cholerae]CSI58705.1 Uncharacterised protein [Vibrio cholerae]